MTTRAHLPDNGEDITSGCLTLGVGLGVAVIVATALLAYGCGGASAETRRSYAAIVAECEANEMVIVARPGTTAASDAADLAAERVRCDAALAEAVR